MTTVRGAAEGRAAMGIADKRAEGEDGGEGGRCRVAFDSADLVK